MSVNLLGFLGVVLLAYLVPGPDFLVIVRASARRAAWGRAAALGAQTGLCVHMFAAALGLSFLAQSAVAFTAIKLSGAAYLVYLGVRAVLAARGIPAESPQRQADRVGHANLTTVKNKPPHESGTRRKSYAEGFVTNVLNPKAALFFLSLLPQFVDHGASMTQQIIFLGSLDVAIGVVYWLGLVTVAAQLQTLMRRPRFRRHWEQTTGGIFIAVGAAVAATG